MNAVSRGPVDSATMFGALSYAQQLENAEAPVCPYCGRSSKLTSVSLGSSVCYRWACPNTPCAAYVGCHKNSLKPLGTLANPNLRKARIRAHAAFDALWRTRKMSRGDAYRLLQEKLGLSEEAAHIGRLDIAQCLQVVKIFGR